MRTIKMIICSIILGASILVSNSPAYSQVTKLVSKTAKAAAKAGTKGATKTVANSLTGFARNEIAHSVPKKFISNVPKSEVKNFAKNIGKTEAKRAFSKVSINSAKEGSEHILVKSTGKTVENVLEKKTLKTSTQKLSQHSLLNPTYVKTKDAIKKAVDKVKSNKPQPVYTHTIGKASKKAGKGEIKDIEKHIYYNKSNGANGNSLGNGATARTPSNGKNGNWTGEKGNSEYVRKPNQNMSKQGGNKEWAENLGTDNISAR